MTLGRRGSPSNCVHVRLFSETHYRGLLVREGLPKRSIPAGATANGAPPDPFNGKWFVHIEGKNYGPYTGHEIRQLIAKQKIVESDLVCPENGSAWAQAKNDQIIGALFPRPRSPEIRHVVRSGRGIQIAAISLF